MEETIRMKKKIGFLINPYAGIGGKAGLKGSDDSGKIQELLGAGYEKTARERAAICMKQLTGLTEECQIVTVTGEMGGNLLETLMFPCEKLPCNHMTTSEDTKRCARQMSKMQVDILVFCGGDGTARDICEAVGQSIPVLGIPAGVKMYSACFANNPYQAGEILTTWISGKLLSCELREVLDIEEKDLDNRKVSPELYGFLKVPDDGVHLQRAKEADTGGYDQVESVARSVVSRMKKDWIYIIGPGGTTWRIKELLYEHRRTSGEKKESGPGTVRGVDVMKNGQVILQDASEKELWKLISEHRNIKILVTCIGGNGFLFGRGNQQISARIIKKVGKEQIEIIATKEKLAKLGGKPMHVDTGDPETDQYLKGYYRITFQDYESAIYKIE